MSDLDPFISSDDLANYLRITLVDDPMAVIALNGACETVRGYMRQQINLVEDDEITLSGTGRPGLLLPQQPVWEVAEVTTTTDGVITTLDAADYVVDSAAILWRLDGYIWPAGHMNVGVTYTHGWLTTEPPGEVAGTVPDDIRLVTLELAAGIYSAGLVGVGGLKSETIGGYSYTLSDTSTPTTLTPDHRQVLDRYRVTA